MIKRDSRGHSYFIVSGEILGFMKDVQLRQRKHLGLPLGSSISSATPLHATSLHTSAWDPPSPSSPPPSASHPLSCCFWSSPSRQLLHADPPNLVDLCFSAGVVVSLPFPPYLPLRLHHLCPTSSSPFPLPPLSLLLLDPPDLVAGRFSASVVVVPPPSLLHLPLRLHYLRSISSSSPSPPLPILSAAAAGSSPSRYLLHVDPPDLVAFTFLLVWWCFHHLCPISLTVSTISGHLLLLPLPSASHLLVANRFTVGVEVSPPSLLYLMLLLLLVVLLADTMEVFLLTPWVGLLLSPSLLWRLWCCNSGCSCWGRITPLRC